MPYYNNNIVMLEDRGNDYEPLNPRLPDPNLTPPF